MVIHLKLNCERYRIGYIGDFKSGQIYEEVNYGRTPERTSFHLSSEERAGVILRGMS